MACNQVAPGPLSAAVMSSIAACSDSLHLLTMFTVRCSHPMGQRDDELAILIHFA